MRFLQARKGDSKKALKMLKAYLDWCETDKVLEIRHKTGKHAHTNTSTHIKPDNHNPIGKASDIDK